MIQLIQTKCLIVRGLNVHLTSNSLVDQSNKSVLIVVSHLIEHAYLTLQYGGIIILSLHLGLTSIFLLTYLGTLLPRRLLSGPIKQTLFRLLKKTFFLPLSH